MSRRKPSYMHILQMPGSMNRTLLTQEALRILLRCSPLFQWETTVKHTNKFMQRMHNSGYTRQNRAQIANSPLKAYGEIQEKNRKEMGRCTGPRNGEEMIDNRRKGRKRKSGIRKEATTPLSFSHLKLNEN